MYKMYTMTTEPLSGLSYITPFSNVGGTRSEEKLSCNKYSRELSLPLVRAGKLTLSLMLWNSLSQETGLRC